MIIIMVYVTMVTATSISKIIGKIILQQKFHSQIMFTDYTEQSNLGWPTIM